MPRVRQIVIGNNAAAFTDIFASIPCRSIELMEDEAGATQGLQIKSLLDNFVTTNVFAFSDEPLQIPNIERYPNGGPLLGLPAQGIVGAFNYRAADKLISVRSNGGAGTTLRITENE